MRGLCKPLALAGVLCAAALAWGIDYTWVGTGGDDDWDTACNWEFMAGLPCDGIPQNTTDDALIPYNDGNGWTIEQRVHTIGDLTIKGDVNFDGDVTLTALAIEFYADDDQIDLIVESGTILGNP